MIFPLMISWNCCPIFFLITAFLDKPLLPSHLDDWVVSSLVFPVLSALFCSASSPGFSPPSSSEQWQSRADCSIQPLQGPPVTEDKAWDLPGCCSALYPHSPLFSRGILSDNPRLPGIHCTQKFSTPLHFCLCDSSFLQFAHPLAQFDVFLLFLFIHRRALIWEASLEPQENPLSLGFCSDCY